MAMSFLKKQSKTFCVDEENCVICQNGFEMEKSIKVSEKVSEKGLLSLIVYSEKRGKLNLHNYLKECMSIVLKRKVLGHRKCRRDFTNAKCVISKAPSPSEPTAKRLWGDSLPYNWKEHCMLCGKLAEIDHRHPEISQVCPVRILPVHKKFSISVTRELTLGDRKIKVILEAALT